MHKKSMAQHILHQFNYMYNHVAAFMNNFIAPCKHKILAWQKTVNWYIRCGIISILWHNEGDESKNIYNKLKNIKNSIKIHTPHIIFVRMHSYLQEFLKIEVDHQGNLTNTFEEFDN